MGSWPPSAGTAGASKSRSATAGASKRVGGAGRSPATTSRLSARAGLRFCTWIELTGPGTWSVCMTEPKVAYAELHCHTHFSFLEGASAPDELIGRAVELGMSGLAVTDHGGLYGVVRFAAAAQEAGLRPVIGIEIEMADAAVPDTAGVVIPERRPRGTGRGRGAGVGVAAGAGASAGR